MGLWVTSARAGGRVVFACDSRGGTVVIVPLFRFFYAGVGSTVTTSVHVRGGMYMQS